MSLVGKELEVTFCSTVGETDEEEEVSTTEEETHPPLSPANGFESMFLGGLKTSQVSANFLATELRRNYRPFRSNSTVATDDYVSTYDNLDDLLKFESASKEAKGLSTQPIYELDENPTTTKMSPLNVDGVNVNAADFLYQGAKNVWGWGKEQMIISTFLGVTESIAGKVVSVVGTDLEEIDGNIKPKLSLLDSNILNPAVRAILGIVMSAAGKSEDFIKPIVVSILKPIGLLKEGKRESVAPELTTVTKPVPVM